VPAVVARTSGQGISFLQTELVLPGTTGDSSEKGLRLGEPVPRPVRQTSRRLPRRDPPAAQRPDDLVRTIRTAWRIGRPDPPEDIDGISYLPELLGQTEAQAKHDYFY